MICIVFFQIAFVLLYKFWGRKIIKPAQQKSLKQYFPCNRLGVALRIDRKWKSPKVSVMQALGFFIMFQSYQGRKKSSFFDLLPYMWHTVKKASTKKTLEREVRLWL